MEWPKSSKPPLFVTGTFLFPPFLIQSKLFELLENNTDRILERDTDLLQKMILATASIKLEIVAIDPHEKGIRCILNFGHTIGKKHLTKIILYILFDFH